VLRRLNHGSQAQEELAKFKQRKTRDMNENMAGAAASRANQSLEQGDPSSAIQGYQEALKLDPDNAKTYYNLALAQERIGDQHGAIASLEKSAALNPVFSPARNQLWLSYLARGQIQEAERQFRTALSNDPQCAECQNNLGVLYGQKGDSTQSEKLFRQALENNPEYTQARVNLGVTLAGHGDFAGAQTELKTALSAEPANMKALTALGMILDSLGKSDEARAAWTKAVQACGNCQSSALLHKNLGLSELHAGAYDAGEKDLTFALQKLPHDPEILHALQTLRH